MGLFGSSSRKKNPWDMSGAWSQFDPSTQDTSQFPQEAPPTAPAEQERWINGGKFRGRDAIGLALGAIGDAFAQRSGGQAVVAPMLLKGFSDQREAKQAAQAAMAKHEQDRADFLWEQQHKAPAPNDTERDLELIRQRYGQAAADQWMQNRIDPIVNIPLPGGATYMGPRSQMPGALGGGQQSAPSAMPTVTDEQSYNALPPGASYRDPSGHIRTKGGGAGNGAGGFHIPSGSPLWP